MLGQYHEQKKSCQNADKKCLSFFVPVKKEGQSVFFYDFHTGTGLSAYGFHLVKPGDTHIHFVEPFPVLQIQTGILWWAHIFRKRSGPPLCRRMRT